MDPQEPTLNPIDSVPQSPQKVKDPHWISILAMAIFVVLTLGIVAFLYYQNQALKSMLASYQAPFPVVSPTPTATVDPTVNWKTYTNDQFKFEFKCPLTSTYKNVDLTTKNGVKFPYSQESCTEGQNQLSISVWRIVNRDVFTLEGKIKELLGASLKPVNYSETTLGQDKMITYQEQNSTNQLERSVALIVMTDKYIRIDGFSKDYFNQILSTFKFLGPLDPRGEEIKKLDTCVPKTEAGSIKCYNQKTQDDCLKMTTDCRWSIALP